MTMFSAIASPGQRWKMFLPGAASVQGEVLSLMATSALIRSRWLSVGARRTPAAIAAPLDGDEALQKTFPASDSLPLRTI
jgi:hypothetical protein